MGSYKNPRLKPFIEYCFDNGKIFFFARPGKAIEIEDENKFILTTCKLMDGVKDITALTQELAHISPQEAPYLNDLLTLLDQEGLLEDTSYFSANSLNKYDMERWSRN